jgi:DNA replication and repair protein RecF
MKITHLSLTNFRNYSRLELDFSEKIALFVGANAQGKTSILEAIYYIATLSSFQAENDRQLINLTAFQSPLAVARIVADFQRGHHKRQIEIRIIKEEKNGNREGNVHKEVLLDGVKKKSVEVVGTLNAILFVPQMLSVIEGAPEVRRRYMNILLAQVIAGYGEQLSLYHKALTQRNALLKRLNEAGGDVNQLDFWDEQLSESGARIIHARIKALHELGKYAKRAHHSLSRQKKCFDWITFLSRSA